ncbi:hypothetical protein DZF91_02310 [Actinomadura logoneensis]|uniref:Mce-associated membrane protein n=1 Tax=Actinomadura logoneensis TaxID=2293572 RepID=A0A372JT60_9ACTN|nr:hypothetical protein [Actinomadura logoneensis]RFU43215.1 hypothetical protein DZF91_02310 [Actinomadura logoneensis]
MKTEKKNTQAEKDKKAAKDKRKVPGTARTRVVALLGVLTVAFGTTAAWAGTKTEAITGNSAAENHALTDNARTSEVKGEVTTALNTVFSYNYADTGKTEQAAKKLLTGDAVRQYNAMFATVRQQAPQQKQILTTTVTDTAVKSLSDDKARLLIFADQRNTRTDKNQTSYSASVFAVTAIRVDGTWKLSAIDTFGG